MRKSAPTLKDIARETGVHVSTVSRALDPQARSNLSPEVIDRIKTTAERLGYRRNRLASGLRTNRTMTVGVMIPDITNTLFPPIVRGIESVLEPLGYASIIANTDSLAEREVRLLDVLRERGIDGILHAAALRKNSVIARIAAQGLPVVTANRKIEDAAIPCVINDEARGIRLILDHLFRNGHRRIAHIAGPQGLSTGWQRCQAFREQSRLLALENDPHLVVEALRFDEEEGRRCAKALVNAGGGFTAILCANDRLAIGAIDMLRTLGLRCPEDVSVTGFNDMPLLDLIWPRLTTIRIKQYDAGKTAGRILLEMMTNTDAEVPAETILPVELIVRDSVAPV